MYKYSYDEFYKDVQKMAKEIEDSFEVDAILGIARGGVALGHFLSHLLDKRVVYTMNSKHYDNKTTKLDTIELYNIPDLSDVKNLLITDDIVDSGDTMAEIKRVLLEKYPHLNLKVATIFYKEKSLLIPEYTVKLATEWVNFFWDIQIKKD